MSLAMIVLVLAGLASLVAWIWLIVWAFQNQEKGWGIVLIVASPAPVIGPLLGIVFCILKWRQVRQPAIILITSTVVGLIGLGVVLREAQKAVQEALQQQAGEVQVRQLLEASRAANAAPSVPEEPVEPTPEPPPSVAGPVPPPPAPRPVRRPDPVESRGAPPRAQNPTVARTGAVRPANLPPLEAKFLSLGQVQNNQLRSVRVRLLNEVSKTVREVKLTLHYVDAKGKRLNSWTTVHGPLDSMVAPQGTNDVEVQGFFVPRFAERVDIEVNGVAFSDGTRWP